MLLWWGMPRLLWLCAALTLSACTTKPWVNGDVACMRQKMDYGGPNHGTATFSDAMSFCQHYTSDDKLGMVHPRAVPLDLRGDPTLQHMAEDPLVNERGYAFVPR